MPGADDPALPPDYRRIQMISYTSGTTGPAKGVMLPDALTFTSACTFMRLSGMTRDDILYSPLPLFHGLSSRMCALPALVLGAHAVIDERFSASRYWERAAHCNATLGYVVHAIVPQIKAQPPGAFGHQHSAVGQEGDAPRELQPLGQRDQAKRVFLAAHGGA